MEDNRSKYLRKMHTPTPFSQGPEMKNYSRMMELQAQAPNFTANDPRFDELKDVRRQYNRFDKYKIGERQGVAPLDVQKQFSEQTNVFRNAAPNVYGKMYPISDLAMRYGESGGLLGMMAKELFGKVKDIGSNITDKIGITGAVDSDEKEMDDYAARTFGFYPTDVHPGLPEINTANNQNEINALKEQIMSNPGTTDFGNLENLYGIRANTFDPEQYVLDNPPKIQTGIFDFSDDNVVEEVPTPEFQGLAPTPDIIEPLPLPFDEGREDYIRDQNEYRVAPLGSPDPHGDFKPTYPQDKPINWDLENNKYYQDLTPEEIDFIFGRTDEIADKDMNVPPPIVPFDDSEREAGIASMYGQGPQWGETDRRYEDEYRDFIANQSDTMRQFGPVTYEEFADMYERIHQGKPHAGLR